MRLALGVGVPSKPSRKSGTGRDQAGGRGRSRYPNGTPAARAKSWSCFNVGRASAFNHRSTLKRRCRPSSSAPVTSRAQESTAGATSTRTVMTPSFRCRPRSGVLPSCCSPPGRIGRTAQCDSPSCLLPRRQSGNLVRPGRVGLCRIPWSPVGVLDHVECCAPGVLVTAVLLGVSGGRWVERGLDDRGPVGAHRLGYLHLVP